MPMNGRMGLDTTLLEHWTAQQEARARARRRLPPRWLDDPREQMGEVTDMYVELFANVERAKPVALRRTPEH